MGKRVLEGLKMKLLRLVAIAGLGVQLTACATIIEGTDQSVSIETPPANGATCTLTSSEGEWFVTAPGSVTVEKTKNDMSVVCKRDGFHDGVATVVPKFQATTAGNILAGGLIGVAVDAASGANYEYPSPIRVDMTPSNQPAPQPIIIEDNIELEEEEVADAEPTS